MNRDLEKWTIRDKPAVRRMILRTAALAITAMMMSSVLGYSYDIANAQQTPLLKINGWVKRSDCKVSIWCPEVGDSNVKVSKEGGTTLYWQGALKNSFTDIPIPAGTRFVVDVLKPTQHDPLNYEFHWEEGYIYGLCTGHKTCAATMPANGGTISVNLHWRCPNLFGC